MQRLMPDSSKTEAEQAVQREFRKSWLITGTLLTLAVLLFRWELNRLPNRTELGPKTVTLSIQPVGIGSGSGAGFRVVGAWRLLADDPRFGGLSALGITENGLIALSDSGVVARFSKPRAGVARVRLNDLPAGPRDGRFKANRDSEALLADPLGRGWWVAFENRDEVWLYDRNFSRHLGRLRLRSDRLGWNRGIEGMAADGARLLLFPESGDRIVQFGETADIPISGLSGWVSDAVRLRDGRLAVLNRQPAPVGLRNFLVVLEPNITGYRAGQSWRIPVGRLDNVEGLAVGPSANGVRLWMITDNNFQQRRPTLLLAVDLKPRPARRPS